MHKNTKLYHTHAIHNGVIDDNFRIALEQSPVPIVLSAEDGEMILINQKCLNVLGYSFEEVNTLEKWMGEIHHNRLEYNIKFVNKVFEEGVTVQGEEEIVYNKSGDSLIWAFHNFIIGNLKDGRKALMTVCIDMTEVRRLDQKQKQLIQELDETKTFLQASIESQKGYILIIIDLNYNYLLYNELHKTVMKDIYNVDIERGMNLLDNIAIESDRIKEKKAYDRALKGESYSRIDIYGENSDLHFESFYSPIFDTQGNVIGASILSHDITDRVREMERIRKSEEHYRMLYSSMSQGLAIHQIIVDEHNNPIDYRAIDINSSYEKLFNVKRENFVGRRIKEMFPGLEDFWIKTFGHVALSGESSYLENYSGTVDRYLSTYSYALGDGKFAVLISDITERVKRAKEIEYLSYSDQLTDVFNRRYYEEQFILKDREDNLPLSLIMGDVNGLKLVNDSFGHGTGDLLLKKLALILKESCRDSDIITRIGGDEFVIILPKTSKLVAKKIIERINKKASKTRIESLELSVSFGCGTKTTMEQSLVEIFKEIEDDMYRMKLSEGHSMRSKTVDLIMTTLYEKNEREMFHSKRVSGLCEAIATALNLEKDQILQARNGGLMHDIGKIGINELILNKSGKLSKDEWKEVKRHSEVGYRILSSVNELSDVANHILMHHEHIDGSGYPKGLKGDEISVQAKIICVADAYDAMTGPRTYRKVLTKQEAILELQRCKGTQFDSEIVDIFVERVLQQE